MRRIVLITFVVFNIIHFPNSCNAEVWQNDFTQDGIVNFLDFAKIASNWQKTQSDTDWIGLYDLFEDGNINFKDLTIFAENWLCLNNITLEVYSDGWGNLLRTITLEKEGPITIYATEEYPYYDPPRYCTYATRDGAFTEIYNCQFGDTIDVDLDNIQKNKLNGTIFMTQYWFADRYLSNTTVNIKNQNLIIAQFQTDSQGRFSIDNLVPGEYYFLFTNWNHAYNVKVIITGEPYQDFFFGDYVQAFKPNIYLYPEQKTQLDVKINFPNSGGVIESIPDYVNGWHITAEPSGLIDGQYRYLFYESLQPDACQYSSGWVVAKENLEEFFRNNMSQTGFITQEIDDFIEYWIPRLDHPYYAIYPQYNNELENMISLSFSKEPTNLIRVIYTLRGMESNSVSLGEPLIPTSSRTGFTVTEWGVILQ